MGTITMVARKTEVRCTFGRSRHAEGLPSICRMCQSWPFPGFHDTEECLPI